MTQGTSKTSMADMRQQLLDGLSVEIAGYTLPPLLAHGFEQAELSPPIRLIETQRCAWFEVSSRKNASLNPASAMSVLNREDAGYLVSKQVMEGPAFWQSAEIEVAPELLVATTNALLASIPEHQ
ncbi:MAG: hypothetical protein CFE44_28655 [Burkholderiales bacterium PBB4]|nr:MAG: hypothetical protein CFE44_28655 [Burkholderiales bacterium PBB4]